MKSKILLLIGVAALMSTYGCTPKLGNVQAEEGRTESTEVPQISIPYEPGYPKVVLVVEPFKTSGTVISYTSGPAGQVPVADSMAAQLRTALSRVANFSLSSPDQKVKMQKGEVGPFFVRATLTEFNENAEGEAEDSGVSLGGVGAAAVEAVGVA